MIKKRRMIKFYYKNNCKNKKFMEKIKMRGMGGKYEENVFYNFSYNGGDKLL